MHVSWSLSKDDFLFGIDEEKGFKKGWMGEIDIFYSILKF